MAEFGLVDAQGNILRYEQHAVQPPDPKGKGWRWLPVTRASFAPDSEVATDPEQPVAPAATVLAFGKASKPIAALKTLKKKQVMAAFSAKIAAGFNWNGHVYQLGANKYGTTGIQDITSKGAQAVAAVDGGLDWPADSGYFRDKANVNVAMTAAELRDMAVACGHYATRLRKHVGQLEADIDDPYVDTKAELDAIDINAGWPANDG